jgi:hypothetical protein
MKLVVNKILDKNDFINYLKTVESFDIINPFYKILGVNISGFSDDNQLWYFTLLSDDETLLILMPFLLRKIPYQDEEIPYYDVISPYGYSGPLFNETMSRGYLILFWEEVDSWYSKNNVISEFIRFSLNQNHQFYSGVLVPTLTNVNGKILKEEKQWHALKQKVRNNYRKSLDNGLEIKMISNGLSDLDISNFYAIYIQTMQRIDADVEYFHSIDYFKRIVELSENNFTIAFVCKDNTAISVELILISGDTLYSFLGGTIAEYFNLRPNDFLKIEVMKWARNNGYKYYLLGGGRKDNDSLYKYKKSFFPNDKDIIYYTGRKIIDKKIYEKLDKLLNCHVITEDIGLEEIKKEVEISFFPAYRKIAITKKD